MSLTLHSSISRPQSRFCPHSISKPPIWQQTLISPSPPFSGFRTALSALTSSNPRTSPRCFCQRSIPSLQFDEPSLTRIFITGLAKSTSEGSLRSAFSLYGEVAHVQIIVDKKERESLGFAYIVFSNEEDAQLAIRQMDGKFFEGRFIYVTNAKPGSAKARAKENAYKF